jgi:hypothetical protein
VVLFSDSEAPENTSRKKNDKRTTITFMKKDFENFPVKLILKDKDFVLA